MKRLLIGLVLAINAVMFFVIACCVVQTLHDDPLRRLERRTMEIREQDYQLNTNPKTKYLVETKRRLEVAALRLGATINNEAPDPGSAGQVVLASRMITIDKDVTDDGREQTLAHELAHCLIPRAIFETYGEKEVFAEAVSFLVTRHEHEDIDAYATYLARHKQYLNILRVYRHEIEFAAVVIWGE